MKICPICKKEFIRKGKPHQVYCSEKCSFKGRKTQVVKMCLVCNQSFKVYLYRKNTAGYCSYKCRGIGISGKNLTKEHKEKISKSCKDINSGSKNANWKNGKTIICGYIFVLEPNHPFCNSHRYIGEHRLVIESQIGYYLAPENRVHHLGIKYPLGSIKNKQHNVPKNLMAFTSESAHQRFHHNPDNVKPSEIIFDGRQTQ